jgi:hypothetical protein
MNNVLADRSLAPDCDRIETVVTNQDMLAPAFGKKQHSDGKVVVNPDRTDVSSYQIIRSSNRFSNFREEWTMSHEVRERLSPRWDEWLVVEEAACGIAKTESRLALALKSVDIVINPYLKETVAVWPQPSLPTAVSGPVLRLDQRSLLSEIERVSEEASEPDWDGEGADPVGRDIVSVARKLVSLFPKVMPPEVSATPHGEIDFDWLIRKDVMLTIAVCRHPRDQGRHEIVFVANFEDVEFRGREPWCDEMPQLVDCCFERMKGWLGGAGKAC